MTQSRTKWILAGMMGVSLLAASGCCSSCCNTCGCGGGGCGCCGGGLHWFRSHSIPDRYPLGSVNRAHYHAMQTNAEASDFVLHRNDFVGETAELTHDGKAHAFEIAARMRSAPFPVLVEQSENNSAPQLDADRRATVAQVLSGLGNGDAEQRVIVANAYDKAISSYEGQFDYYRWIWSRGGFGGYGNFNGFGANGIGFGGLGGFGAAGGYGFGN
jgi:hypothetical protein